MQKLIDILDQAKQAVADEVDGKKSRSSETLNKLLLDNYKHTSALSDTRSQSSKALLLAAWKHVVNGASTERASIKTWAKLFKSLDGVLAAMYVNENTREATLTQFRSPIKQRFGADSEVYKQSIYQTGVSQERSRQKKEDYRSAVEARNANRSKLPVIYVEDVLDLINKLKVSDSIYDRFIAVLLATGSRSIEVAKVSQYSIPPDDGTTRISIVGLAKDSGSNDVKQPLIRNLVGMTAEEVITNVDLIRSNLNLSGTNVQIANRINSALNKVFKNVIKGLVPDSQFTAHKCRYISGNVSYKLYGEPQKLAYESYLQQQYGHLSADSTKSYLAVNIEFKGDRRDAARVPVEADMKAELKAEIKAELKAELNRELKKELCLPDNEAGAMLREFRNNPTIKDREEKIKRVIDAVNVIRSKGIKIRQSELRKILGYSSDVMTAAYKRVAVQLAPPDSD